MLAAIATADSTVNLLVFETDKTLAANNNLLTAHVEGLEAQVVGLGQKFTGFGSKYEAVLPALQELSPTSITVVSDGRDVLLNHAMQNRDTVTGFVNAFEKLTDGKDGAIVLSAEAQCCVSALTHVVPGGLFAEDGERTGRACYSGKDGCRWNGDDKALPWETFMQEVAIERGAKGREDVYLNAGLMVGRASDLIRIIRATDIGKNEDDQAVLTDYMYRNPGQILLDYSQELFGNNRERCMFELQENHLVHTQTRTAPLFIHTPGGSSTCHVELMAELGQKSMSKKAKRRLLEWKEDKGNYGDCEATFKMVSGYCVKDWCMEDFTCPDNSERKADRECYNNFHDCQCNTGFVMNSRGKCRKARFSYW